MPARRFRSFAETGCGTSPGGWRPAARSAIRRLDTGRRHEGRNPAPGCVCHSFREGRGWLSLETGYTWHEGAPADQIPVWAEVGYPLPLWRANFKATATFVRSRYNYSTQQPDDRFGASATNNFNAASMLRLGGAFLVPIGSRWSLEAGYGQWVWGRSARRYKEPYFSFGYRL